MNAFPEKSDAYRRSRKQSGFRILVDARSAPIALAFNFILTMKGMSVNRIESAAAIETLDSLELILPSNPVTCDATYEAVVVTRAVGLGQAARRAIAATAETVKWRGFDGGFASSDTFDLAGRTGVSDMPATELIALRTSI